MSTKKKKDTIVKRFPEEVQNIISSFLEEKQNNSEKSIKDILVKIEAGKTYINREGIYIHIEEINTVSNVSEKKTIESYEKSTGIRASSIDKIPEEHHICQQPIS